MRFVPATFDEGLKGLSVVGAIFSFFWAVYQWKSSQDAIVVQRQDEISKMTVQRRIEAQTPFLTKQLFLYTEITQITSRLATLPASPERSQSLDRFWELYWGELALVENRDVEAEMKRFGDALKEPNVEAGETLQRCSLALAHAIRESLDQSWSINIWTENRR